MTQFIGIALHVGSLMQMVRDGKTLTADVIAGQFKATDVAAFLKDAVGLVALLSLPAPFAQEATSILNALITGLGQI